MLDSVLGVKTRAAQLPERMLRNARVSGRGCVPAIIGAESWQEAKV
jgi:hypothetical protein